MNTASEIGKYVDIHAKEKKKRTNLFFARLQFDTN